MTSELPLIRFAGAARSLTLSCVENKTTYEISVLDAMRMLLLRKAWADVTQQTAANCFAKAGFQLSMCVDGVPGETMTGDDDDDEFDEEDHLPLSHLLHASRRQV